MIAAPYSALFHALDWAEQAQDLLRGFQALLGRADLTEDDRDNIELLHQHLMEGLQAAQAEVRHCFSALHAAQTEAGNPDAVET